MSTQTMDVAGLKVRRGELLFVITEKRQALGAAMVARKPTAGLLDELTRLEAEANAIPAAIEQAEQQAREQAAARAEADRLLEAKAQAELMEAERGAVTILASLCAQFDLVDQRRARTRTLGSPVIGSHLVETCRGSLDLIRQFSPELLGLPAKPSPKEARRLELKQAIRVQEEVLAHELEIQNDREQPARWRAEAERKAEETRRVIADLKKQLAEL